MEPQRILIQLDPDRHASVFDAVVAIDSNVQHLLQYSDVEPESVRGLVHGAMFTRGPADLKNTAIFVGGSQVSAGEALFKAVRQSFFGPVRCSVMFDGNGANTTAVAAVLSAAKHLPLSGCRSVVLGGTGPVGGRVAKLMARQGSHVCLVSRDLAKAQSACEQILKQIGSTDQAALQACASSDQNALRVALGEAQVVFACGAAGVQLLNRDQLSACPKLKVVIDLNAVPPEGIEGISVMDKAVQRGERFDYGAVGVGGLKMKIHRAAIGKLFTCNDAVLDAEEIFAIGQSL
ncbi:MAG: bifunctional NADP-dependent methylenetetrahydromethanopterin dehydrogenase/methylenetetrahydrofolate dehydrogenase [Pirellulaceae bacterium]|nr:bifunctional NADP-dependent methylenetetrahydromethanopterin dehydrogenase/methylenetetrahydrofolate dehydrogenase [Pirellulaceae bacterium]